MAHLGLASQQVYLGGCGRMDENANGIPDTLKDGVVVDTDNSAQSLGVVICQHLNDVVTQLGVA
jgi:hypothetical protein